MKIEIWSDIACPYCYIGKRKLENALRLFPDAEKIELIWKCYELNPSLGTTPVKENIYQFLASNQGISENQVRVNFENILKLGLEAGIKFNPESIKVTNTFDALRLTKLAQRYDLASEAEEILFKAYFEEGKDISDINTLTALGLEIGIPADAITKMLNSSGFSDDVKNDMDRAENELDLEYIPFYYLNNKYIIQGSLAIADYLKVIETAYNDWVKNGISENSAKKDIISGKSCSIDGVCDL